MPWNDNANPGPWGSPPQGDGSGKPGGERNDEPRRDEPRRRLPPPTPGGPRIPDWARELVETLRRMFTGPRGRGVQPNMVAAALGLLFFLWANFAGWYVVDTNQEAVITRFGAYDRSVGPGLHYHLPAPIERHELVSVTNQRKTVIGGDAGAEDPAEALMLTGDQNIVDLNFAVQWHVSDAPSFLFNIRDPDDDHNHGEATVKAVAESAMREVIGHSNLQPVLTDGRALVQSQATALTQRILDSYHAGVIIDAVQIQNASAPQPVIGAYQDIAKSEQDRARAVNEANTYRNQKVTEAKGTASQLVADAQAYREQVVLQAQGDASAFNQVYEQYRRAPGVTRQRLYIETMQAILTRSNKVVIDAKGSTAPIILPPDVFRQRGDPAAPVVQVAPAPAAPGNGQ